MAKKNNLRKVFFKNQMQNLFKTRSFFGANVDQFLTLVIEQEQFVTKKVTILLGKLYLRFPGDPWTKIFQVLWLTITKVGRELLLSHYSSDLKDISIGIYRKMTSSQKAFDVYHITSITK